MCIYLVIVNPYGAEHDYTALQSQKAVTAYFTTCKISSYCLLALHSSVVVFISRP